VHIKEPSLRTSLGETDSRGLLPFCEPRIQSVGAEGYQRHLVLACGWHTIISLIFDHYSTGNAGSRKSSGECSTDCISSAQISSNGRLRTRLEEARKPVLLSHVM